MTFLQSFDLPGLWIDAYVLDHLCQPLFISAWGNEAHVQHFRARLSLAGNDVNRLRQFRLDSQYITVGDTKSLDSLTARPDKSPFVSLTHVWVYNKLSHTPDQIGLRSLLFDQGREPDETFLLRIWQAVMQLSPIPLLAEWNILFNEFCELGFIKKHIGLAINAYVISLDEKVLTEFIQEKLHKNLLFLPK